MRPRQSSVSSVGSRWNSTLRSGIQYSAELRLLPVLFLLLSWRLFLRGACGHTREALLSEAGFEKVFRTQNWVCRSKQFCRWFCFLLGQVGCILVAAWTHLKLASYYFVASGGLIVCRQKKAHQPFAALRWLLEVFLAVEEFVGFSRRWPASIWMIVLNTLLPLVGPPCPSRLLPKFSAQKEHESWSFQSIPLLINSINLKRDGVGICLGKYVAGWRIEGFLTPPSFRYRVNYIG